MDLISWSNTIYSIPYYDQLNVRTTDKITKHRMEDIIIRKPS